MTLLFVYYKHIHSDELMTVFEVCIVLTLYEERRVALRSAVQHWAGRWGPKNGRIWKAVPVSFLGVSTECGWRQSPSLSDREIRGKKCLQNSRQLDDERIN